MLGLYGGISRVDPLHASHPPICCSDPYLIIGHLFFFFFSHSFFDIIWTQFCDCHCIYFISNGGPDIFFFRASLCVIIWLRKLSISASLNLGFLYLSALVDGSMSCGCSKLSVYYVRKFIKKCSAHLRSTIYLPTTLAIESLRLISSPLTKLLQIHRRHYRYSTFDFDMISEMSP